MKIKTATLIAAIFSLLEVVASVCNYIDVLSKNVDFELSKGYLLSQPIYILGSVAMTLFLFVLYKNQK